jgi:hypothetical protein
MIDLVSSPNVSCYIEDICFVRCHADWSLCEPTRCGSPVGLPNSARALTLMIASKTGRNDPCPCGSNKKYKKCCGQNLRHLTSTPVDPPIPRELLRKISRQHEQDQEHRRRFGEIRPAIWMDFQGQRVVAVGNRLLWKKGWTFFPDFLLDYVPTLFGREWWDEEMARPESERHPVWQWRAAGIQFMHAQERQQDGTFAAFPNGLLAGYMTFAYDLYVVHDNSRLDELLLNRLKNKDQFQGARHELFAEATCLRAGYTLRRENEQDRARRHAEFTAVHKASVASISVEAKSKHRPGILGRLQHTIQPPQHRQRQHDILILIRTIRPTQQISNRPNKINLLPEIVHNAPETTPQGFLTFRSATSNRHAIIAPYRKE